MWGEDIISPREGSHEPTGAHDPGVRVVRRKDDGDVEIRRPDQIHFLPVVGG